VPRAQAPATLDSMAALAYPGAIMAKPKTDPNYRVIAENRRARFDYAIEDDLECGIVLEGT
jgi:SsrA-binding protein